MVHFGVRRSSHLNHGLSGSCFKSKVIRANLSSNTLNSVLTSWVSKCHFFFFKANYGTAIITYM